MIVSEQDICRIKSELCRRSFYHFFIEFWDIIGRGDELNDNWHIKAICDEVQVAVLRVVERRAKLYDLLINIAPGQTKSSILSVALPVWCWLLNPKLRIITATYETTLAEGFARLRKDVIKSNKFVLFFCGGGRNGIVIRRDVDGVAQFQNTIGGIMWAVGTGGNITGIHADLKIVDDAINPQAAHSLAARRTVNTWVRETIASRNTNHAITLSIFVGQRLHVDDAYATFLEVGYKVRHINLPAYLDETAVVLPAEWRKNYDSTGLFNPSRLTYGMLEQFRHNGNFEGQFMQRPAKSGGNLIKPSEWFFEYEYAELLAQSSAAGERLVWHFEVDGAYTKNTKNDPTAVLAWCLFKNRLYIRNVAEFYYTITELTAQLPIWLQANGYGVGSVVNIEPKASGKDLVSTLVSYSGVNARESYTPIGSKEERANSVLHLLSSGRVGVAAGGSFVVKFFEQLVNFPNATHDDMTDCLVMAVKNSGILGGAAVRYYGNISPQMIAPQAVGSLSGRYYFVFERIGVRAVMLVIHYDKQLQLISVLSQHIGTDNNIAELVLAAYKAGGLERGVNLELLNVCLYGDEIARRTQNDLNVQGEKDLRRLGLPLAITKVVIREAKDVPIRQAINAILGGSFKGHTLQIDPTCIGLINDFNFIMLSDSGTKQRGAGNDLGTYSDCFGVVVQSIFNL